MIFLNYKNQRSYLFCCFSSFRIRSFSAAEGLDFIEDMNIITPDNSFKGRISLLT